MYTAERWVYIQRLMENERKRGGENVEVVEKRLKKRKPYAKEKDYSFDREVDEIQAEIDAGRENKTKRKSDAPTEAAKKAKHDESGKSTETVIGLRGEIDSLKAELVDLKSKYADLETQDAEKSTVIFEMGRMMKDQQCLIVRIFKELNSLKEKDGSDPAMSEAELKNLTDAAKYPLMDCEFGDKDKGKGKAAEDLFDEDMGIDLDIFEGAEVVGGSSVNFTLIDEPEVDVNADSEEDLEDEPEKYKVEEKGLDQSIEKRFEKPVEVVDLDVTGEEPTENIQAETIDIDMPDTDVAEAEFVESVLVFSEDEEAGSEDVTNPLAGIESRAGAYVENI
ncbi:hypothetical protein QVD17_08877 [Tagetes erecta]|uniref:Uncharacterized protein n=1 Tax=Tagetes erecta TaxID=13708 RepID=A0AAD8KZX4_TARER|nr:hypothetical protein QVD17_08877 [Tagetes erecta]